MVAQHVELQRVSDIVETVIVAGVRAGALERDNGMWLARPAGHHPTWFTSRDEALDHIAQLGPQHHDTWQRALRRAVVAGLDPIAVAGLPGAWFVPSASSVDHGYLVRLDGVTCTCPAHAAGRACLHRAVVRHVAGTLAMDERYHPDPAPAGPACRACDGRGVIHHQRLDAARGPWRCPACGGAGRAAA